MDKSSTLPGNGKAWVVMMHPNATAKETGHVLQVIEDLGKTPYLSKGDRTVIGVIPRDGTGLEIGQLSHLPGVEQVVPLTTPYRLTSRMMKSQPTRVEVDGVSIGSGTFTVIAGPCSVESFEQTRLAAKAVKEAGATVLRAGAYKPRSSPYSFQGLGEEGLRILAEVKREVGLPIATELLDVHHLDAVLKVADIIQIGARNMQNFALLEAVGRQPKPILLKRGIMATVEEWLLAAEYVMNQGNHRVILCERGIRTFETSTRNTLDVAAVPFVKSVSHLPIIVDPSHAAGRRDFVPALALAGLAAGADGLLVEMHPDPDHALSDGPQSLTFDQFRNLMQTVQSLWAALPRA